MVEFLDHKCSNRTTNFSLSNKENKNHWQYCQFLAIFGDKNPEEKKQTLAISPVFGNLVFNSPSKNRAIHPINLVRTK